MSDSTWNPMSSAPRNATWLLLRVPKEKGWPSYYAVVAHWADGGGDEQPRFRGWFYDPGGGGYRQVEPEPTGWMELPEGVYER